MRSSLRVINFIGATILTELLSVSVAAGQCTRCGPGATVAPRTLTFPPQIVGTRSAVQTITVTNIIPYQSVSVVTSAPFQSGGCGRTSSTSCTINVTFAPVVVGPANGEILVRDGTALGGGRVTLSGTWVASTGGNPSFLISYIGPASGPLSGGTAINIQGSGFQAGASVTIGGTSATVTSVSDTQINATTGAASTPGTYDVIVTNPGGGFAVLDYGFTYLSSTGCVFSISSTSASYPSDGVPSNKVNVATTGGCSWTAISNEPWITITSGSSGSGNGVVAFSVSA